MVVKACWIEPNLGSRNEDHTITKAELETSLLIARSFMQPKWNSQEAFSKDSHKHYFYISKLCTDLLGRFIRALNYTSENKSLTMRKAFHYDFYRPKRHADVCYIITLYNRKRRQLILEKETTLKNRVLGRAFKRSSITGRSFGQTIKFLQSSQLEHKSYTFALLN